MQTQDYINLSIGLGTFITAIATIILALITQASVRASRRNSRGDFLLRLDEAFRHYQEIHAKLRPGGSWCDHGKGPVSQEDWIAVDSYMGLFERIQVLVEQKVIDVATVERLYGYRLFNIVANEAICQEKLTEPKERAQWSDFIKLWKALQQAEEIREHASRKRIKGREPTY